MHSERKKKRHWGITIFLTLLVILLAGATVYLIHVRERWRNDIHSTMDANVEYGGKISLVEETLKKRVEFFLARSLRELPSQSIFQTTDLLRVLNATAPKAVEFHEITIDPRLQTLAFSIKGHYEGTTPGAFDSRWQTFLQRLEEELPILDIAPSITGGSDGMGEFTITGELELQ